MAVFSRLKIWSFGEILTDTALNAEFDNIINHMNPLGIDGNSQTLADMQSKVDPGELGTESKAGELQGELLRIRFKLAEIQGTTNWYPTVLDNQTPTPQTVSLTSLYSQISGFLSNIMPPGMVAPYTGTTAPTNWLLCDGSAVSRVTYQNLYNVVGTTYGTGDGTTTFNLPDYRGMFLRGAVPTMSNIVGSGSVSGPDYNATFVGHGLKTGQRVKYASGSIGGTGPYFGGGPLFVYVVDANTIRFYNTRARAFANNTAFADPATGTNSLVIKTAFDYDGDIRQGAASGSNATGVGSYQTDAISTHSHTANSSSVITSVAYTTGTVTNSTAPFVSSNGSASPAITVLQNITGTNNVDSMISSYNPEVRPQNIAVNYIIRY